MKKIISLILIIILICSSTSALADYHYAKADEGAVGMYDFENFTEEDAISFVEEHNIETPQKIRDWEKLAFLPNN